MDIPLSPVTALIGYFQRTLDLHSFTVSVVPYPMMALVYITPELKKGIRAVITAERTTANP